MIPADFTNLQLHHVRLGLVCSKLFRDVGDQRIVETGNDELGWAPLHAHAVHTGREGRADSESRAKEEHL